MLGDLLLTSAGSTIQTPVDGVSLLPPVLLFVLTVAFLVLGPMIGAAAIGLIVSVVQATRRARSRGGAAARRTRPGAGRT